MPPFILKHRMCLNDMAVPFVARTLCLHDLHSLAGGDIDNQEFLLLSLKATADVRWLEAAFNLSGRWWVNHHGSSTVPLLLEIRKAIEIKKVTTGYGCRLPRLPNSIVAIRIRGKVIFVQNQTKDLTLAFKSGEEIEGLKWFVAELGTDLGNRHEWEAPPRKRNRTEEQDGDANLDDMTKDPPASSKQQRHYLGHHEHELVQKSVDTLMEHPGCLQARFLPSRASFRVTKKDRSSKEFIVSGLNKHRKKAEIGDDDLALMRPMFEKTVAGALAFLERCPPQGIEDLD
jgi:hypothetical protein